jgi:hypothetical protein
MRFSVSTLVTLLPLVLSLVVSIEALPDEDEEPRTLCSVIAQPDPFKWFDRLYLKPLTKGTITGIAVEQTITLNKQDFYFQAASYDQGYDFVKLDTDKFGTGQFKFSFLDHLDSAIVSVWATNGAWCKIPYKLDRSQVEGFAIQMRNFK